MVDNVVPVDFVVAASATAKHIQTINRPTETAIITIVNIFGCKKDVPLPPLHHTKKN